MNKIALITLALCAAALLGIAPPIQDDEADVLPENRDWLEYIFDGNSTTDMQERCSETTGVLNKRMYLVLEEFYAILDDEGDALLKQTQKDWLAYAISKQSLAADAYRSGTLAGPVSGASFVEESCRRITELKIQIAARGSK